MPLTYRPLLRTKAGETTALRHLTPGAKQRIMPVFHMTGKIPVRFAPGLIHAWAGSTVALDGHYNFGVTGAMTDFQSLFRELAAGGVSVLACAEVNAPPPYLQAVKSLAGKNPRMIVKATLRQLPGAIQWARSEGLLTSNIDLLVYAGHVTDIGVDALEPVVRTLLTSNIPKPLPWRSVTLGGSAFPKDMGSLNFGRNEVPRLDWELWRRVYKHASFPLDYADCAAGHPDLQEPPGVAMARATVSVRYTCDDKWIVLKGKPITGQTGQPMDQQYRAHAKTLKRDAEFGGVAGCWADERIKQIDAGTIKSGNRTTWVEIAANRHISLVADRLP